MTDEISNAVSKIIIAENDHKLQIDKLNALLQEALTTTDNEDTMCKNVIKLADAVVNQESVSMVVSRQFVSDLVEVMNSLPLGAVKAIGNGLLSSIHSRLISYEEQVAQIRFKLADIYENEGEAKEAAKMLIAVPLETGQRSYTPEVKMETYLRIAQLALSYGDAAEAEAYINRASMLLTDVKNDNNRLSVMYKALYARVLDHRHKFIEAAQRYYELSLMPALLLQEKQNALTNAISCAILASPGGQRSRMLTSLYKDERCERLPSYGILEKMHLERIIKQEEVAEFEKTLPEHERTFVDGGSILEKAVVEHNIIAIGNIFVNISFDQLAQLLNIEVSRAERMTWNMIAEKRINATIDQLKGFIHFTQPDVITSWDQQISDLCQHVNCIVDMILQEQKSWANSHLSEAAAQPEVQ
uniref:COP9 signalosome complex subunit 4 n=1 Tax=Syphacia muris TaxID=451379 RepID=A0A0N5A823_9BILA